MKPPRLALPLLLARRCRWLLAFVVTATLPFFALAQSAESGVVTGTVLNASTQKVLERALVTVVGTNLSTLTSADGRFRLSGLPAGSNTLRVSYTGLQDASVSVEAGPVAASVEITLKSDIIVLSEYRVSAEAEGNAYAVQQQRNAESQRNVVSADAFGVVSDANPGEFLKLMPGIQMDYTGVEPRGLMVRGMETNLNLVMINGNQAAAASSSSTNRTFEFDQTTIDNIESIEVFKAPIPSMPANSIGGTVNLITRSAFLQRGRRVNATINLTGNSDDLSFSESSGPNEKPTRKINPGGSFTYSDTFMDGRLGVVLSLSQVTVNGFGGTAYNTYTYVTPPAAPAPFTADTSAYVSQYQREDHQNFTIRSGAALSLDYLVSDATTVFLRTTFTDHDYEFRNRFFRLNTGTPVAGFSPQRVEATNGNAEQSMSFGDKYSQSITVNPGAKHRLGAWTLEYDGSLSRATNHYEYLPRMFGGVTLRNSGIGFVLEKDPTRATATRITQTAGTDVYNLANYAPVANGFTTSNRSAEDTVTALKGRVRRDFTARFPFYVEGGASYQKQKRERQQPNRRYSYAGPDGVIGTADDTTQAGMQQFAERGYTPNLWFGERAPNAWISPFQLADLYAITPAAFVEDVPNSYEQAFRNNQMVSEEIYAAYAMSNIKFGRLDVLIGTRLEQTYVEGEGARQNNTLVPAGVSPTSLQGMIAKYTRTRASANYTPDPFKYVHLTWHQTQELQARASYSEAIGRPNFGNIIPGITVNDTARTVTASNTELSPARSKNLDLSLEWYPGRYNSFTFAWFRKDISDYINANTVTITEAMPELDIGSELIGYALTTSFNLGQAEIEGIEFGSRYRFDFLSGWASGLEAFANYTRLYKTEGTFTTSAATVYDQLPNLAPSTWNAGASYTSPGSKFFVQLKANYVNDIPRNITGRPQEQSDSRLTYEAEVRYSLSPRYTLSLAGRNITEAGEGGSQLGRAIRTGTGGGAALTATLAARF